jgi:hypothetical protein
MEVFWFTVLEAEKSKKRVPASGKDIFAASEYDRGHYMVR